MAASLSAEKLLILFNQKKSIDLSWLKSIRDWPTCNKQQKTMSHCQRCDFFPANKLNRLNVI